MGRRLLVVVLVLLVGSAGAAATGAPRDDGAVSPAHPTVRWTGQLSSGASDAQPVRVDVPASYWGRHPGGVSVRVEWTARDTELDLRVADGDGRELAQSVYGGRTFQQVYLFRPGSGTYTVSIEAVVAAAADYTATVSLVADPVRQARLVPGGMRFSQGLVDPQVLAAEPGIAFAPSGRSFVVAPWGLTTLSSMLWSSEDGGRSHRLASTQVAEGVSAGSQRPCPGAVGGADSDVAVDATGRLYFAALSAASVSVGYSVDHGATWTCTPVGSSIPEDDRPWLAPAPTADGEGPGTDAYLVYHDLVLGQLPVGQEVKPVQIHVDATRDGGRTWQARSAFGRGLVPFAGPVFTARDGTVYQSFQAGNAAWLARSTDEGATFTLHRVAQRHGDAGNAWVTGAVDAGGTVYVAWVDGGSYQALYSYSRDRGVSWSRPTRVSRPGDAAMLPWVSAGAPGDVAVSWYAAQSAQIPDHVAAGTAWYPYVARSARGDVASPTFELARLSDLPVHRGPVCTACTGDHGRLGDMLETAIGADGQLVAVYADNARADPAFDPPYPYLVLARQVAGQGLSTSEAARAAVVVERPGDGSGPKELDLAGLPTAVAAGPTLRVSFPLASVGDALPAASAGRSDAVWLVLWKGDDRMNYVGMRVDPSGARDFFGGDTPVGVEAGVGAVPALRRQLYATYPPAFPVRGSVDQARGVVTVEAPLERFGLSRGDTLHRLQAFTLTSVTSVRGEATMPRAVDSTPARDVRLR